MMRKKGRLKLLLNVILLVGFLLLALPLILGASSFFIELAGSDYIFKLTIGKSMFPTVKHGDVIVVQKGADNIQVGDIISFKVKSIPVGILHRVVKIIKRGQDLAFKTKGDGNDFIDSWEITADQIIGKAILIIPTSLFLMPYVLAPTILLPAIIISKKLVSYHFKKTTMSQPLKYPTQNPTTILLIMIMTISIGNFLSLTLSLII